MVYNKTDRKYNKKQNYNSRRQDYDSRRQNTNSKEYLEGLKKKNEYIIKKIKEWQSFKYIKHLTCNVEDCNTELVPKEINNRVVLLCPKCKEIQNYIPKVVLKTNFSFPFFKKWLH